MDQAIYSLASYQDCRRRLTELAMQTEKAMAAGNFKSAEELARQQEALASVLVKIRITDPKTGRILLSNKAARLQNMAALRKARKSILAAMEGQLRQARMEAEAAGARVEVFQGALSALNADLDGLREYQARLNNISAEELSQEIKALVAEANKPENPELMTIFQELLEPKHQ